MTRRIAARKGGRTARAPEARIRPATLDRIHAEMQERGKSWGDLIEEQYSQEENEMADKFYTVIQTSGWQGDHWRVAKTFTDKAQAEEFKSKKHQRTDPKTDFYNVRVMPHNKKLTDLMRQGDPDHVRFSDGTTATYN